ncbi:hypothetical protein NDU88_006876 [Pleurodeles waltl]|uniref:RNase H type-1 domain-containing protein n=1 Tax=Pleurodeles waltl TaxID=8319 RepID=A0AAV7PJN8_PLEWA|nr:hypothetical protein NDU88_006876 [Pleurodeles waltl]
MAQDAKVQDALALLKQAGRMDLVREEALAPGRPARRASAGVAVAVAACSPPRAAAGIQVRGVARGGGREAGPGFPRASLGAGRPQASSGSRRAAHRSGKDALGPARRLGHVRQKTGGAPQGLGAGQALPHHHVRMKVGVQENLRMWVNFWESFNGIPLKVWCDWEWDVQLFSDAAGSTGFGLYWEGRWCAGEWLNEWKNGGRSIAFLELFPLIVVVCLWGAELRHSRVLFRVDNMAVEQMVNRQSAREAGVLQLMRVFVLQCLQNDIHFRVRHVPGVNNDIADALSRYQWERFHGLARGYLFHISKQLHGMKLDMLPLKESEIANV